MGKARRVEWDEVAPYGDEKADRRLIAGRLGDFKRVCVKAGFYAPRHEHGFEQFFMMAEGTGVLVCEDGEFLLRPGVVVHFEANVWHETKFETDAVVYEVNFHEV